MEITATEILRQAGRVREETEKFDKACNSIIIMLEEMSKIVKSTDSKLSVKIRQYSNGYIRIQATLNKKFNNLSNIMTNYAQRTLKNEEEMAIITEQESNQLENTVSTTDVKPEFYVDFN